MRWRFWLVQKVVVVNGHFRIAPCGVDVEHPSLIGCLRPVLHRDLDALEEADECPIVRQRRSAELGQDPFGQAQPQRYPDLGDQGVLAHHGVDVRVGRDLATMGHHQVLLDHLRPPVGAVHGVGGKGRGKLLHHETLAVEVAIVRARRFKGQGEHDAVRHEARSVQPLADVVGGKTQLGHETRLQRPEIRIDIGPYQVA